MASAPLSRAVFLRPTDSQSGEEALWPHECQSSTVTRTQASCVALPSFVKNVSPDNDRVFRTSRGTVTSIRNEFFNSRKTRSASGVSTKVFRGAVFICWWAWKDRAYIQSRVLDCCTKTKTKKVYFQYVTHIDIQRYADARETRRDCRIKLRRVRKKEKKVYLK